MSKKRKVYDQEGWAKSQAIKGSVRSTIGFDLVHKFKSSTVEDKKRKSKSSTRNIKHKGRGHDLY
jgi:hypothetical protein